jgi:diguanylate cyclase (GGDEF)-like protein
MEKELETWKTAPKRPERVESQAAILVQIYPPGPGLGSCHPLSVAALVIGRGDETDIQLKHITVSRRHAQIRTEYDGHYVTDLESTNGTLVNDQVVTGRQLLRNGDYVRIGSFILRFLASGNLEAAYHEEIYRLTIIDALTEVPNKRFLLEALDRELGRALRYGRPLALAMMDIDEFKRINDRVGHLGGDFALRELSASIRPFIRREDILGRFGGEEFTFILPETDASQAMAFCERIRDLVANYPFQFEGKTFPVTVSMGVATTSGEQPLSVLQFIKQADDKLYQAKEEGRNRVVG